MHRSNERNMTSKKKIVNVITVFSGMCECMRGAVKSKMTTTKTEYTRYNCITEQSIRCHLQILHARSESKVRYLMQILQCARISVFHFVLFVAIFSQSSCYVVHFGYRHTGRSLPQTHDKAQKTHPYKDNQSESNNNEKKKKYHEKGQINSLLL